MRRLLWLTVLCCACGGVGMLPVDGGEVPVTDAGPPVDAGRRDAGLLDAGQRDGGSSDAGQPDAGPIVDPGNCLREPAYNTVVNAGFECPASTAWSISNGSGAVVDGGHSGSKAMHAVANAQGEARVGQDLAVADSEGKV